MRKEAKPLLGVRFDGVIHDGTYDPRRSPLILGKPREGAFRFLHKAREIFDIQIISERRGFGERNAMRYWFRRFGWPTKVGGSLESLRIGPWEKREPFLTVPPEGEEFCGQFPDVNELTKLGPIVYR